MNDGTDLAQIYQKYVVEADSLRRRITGRPADPANRQRIARLNDLKTRLIPRTQARLAAADRQSD
mgnify:CR=1